MGMVVPYESISFADVQTEATRLATGDTSTVDAWFAGTDISHPVVVWDPDRTDLVTAPIIFLYDYWKARVPEGEVGMRASDLAPYDLVPALGYIMLLDILDGGRDFRYRLFGSKIAEIAKFDSTGLRISETKAHPLMKAFFSTVYEAVLQKRLPIYTEHNPPPNLTIATWHRVVLPLHDGSGTITKFLVGNVPTPYHDPEVRTAKLFD